MAYWVPTLWIRNKARRPRAADRLLDRTCVWFLVVSIKSLPACTLNRQGQLRPCIKWAFHKPDVLFVNTVPPVLDRLVACLTLIVRWSDYCLFFFFMGGKRLLFLDAVFGSKYGGWLVDPTFLFVLGLFRNVRTLIKFFFLNLKRFHFERLD